jgi:chromosome segregation ATPase
MTIEIETDRDSIETERDSAHFTRFIIAQIIDTLSRMEKIMEITQQQVDTFTSEVAAVKTALDGTSTRVQAVQGELVTVKAEVETLKAQIAAAGVSFDSSKLDAALTAATTEADGIAQTVAATPAPVVPA